MLNNPITFGEKLYENTASFALLVACAPNPLGGFQKPWAKIESGEVFIIVDEHDGTDSVARQVGLPTFSGFKVLVAGSGVCGWIEKDVLIERCEEYRAEPSS